METGRHCSEFSTLLGELPPFAIPDELKVWNHLDAPAQWRRLQPKLIH